MGLRSRRQPSSPAPPEDSDVFYVELRSSGTTITVRSGQSILEALHNHGIQVASMCRSGMCGTCQTRVLRGEIEHHDTFLTTEQQTRNDYVMPCVSRAPHGQHVILDL